MITLNLNRSFNKQKIIQYYGIELSVPDHGFLTLKKDTTFSDDNHYIVVWFRYKPVWNKHEGWADTSQVSKILAEVSSSSNLLTTEDLITSLIDVSQY